MAIFVRIPSYRDPELLPTLHDLVTKAAYPKDLRIGLCWQRDESETLGPYLDDPRFRIINVPYLEARGTNWARSRIEGLYDGEEFTLSLDSHHRFVPGWDAKLIAMMEQVDSAKPVLTTYPPNYVPGQPLQAAPGAPALCFRWFNPDGPIRTVGYFMAADDYGERPVPGRFYSANFAFTIGRILEEVPCDPHLYFLGDETNTAVRAFTHGYDLYHPHENVCWHEYNRRGKPKPWDEGAASDDALSWDQREGAGLARFRRLFGIDPADPTEKFGVYGFGKTRSLSDYEAYAGVDFGLQGVQEYTLQRHPPPNPPIRVGSSKWLDSLVTLRHLDIEIRLSQVEPLAASGKPVIALHNDAGELLCQYPLSGDDLTRLLGSLEVMLAIKYLSREPATSWTMYVPELSSGNRTISAPITT